MPLQSIFRHKNGKTALLAGHRPQGRQVFVRLCDVIIIRAAQLLEEFIASIHSSVLVLLFRNVRRWIAVDHPQPSDDEIGADDRRTYICGREPVEHALQSKNHLWLPCLDYLPPSDPQSRVAERVFWRRGFVDHSARRCHH